MFFPVLFVLFLLPTSFCKSGDNNVETKKLSKLEILELMKQSQMPSSDSFFDLNSRKTKSYIYSFFIPGAGQTYLGNSLKGAAFTIGFLGAGLGAVLNHNNFVAREERLENLSKDYLNAADFVSADRAWQELMNEKGNRDKDNDRRKYFAYATIGIWVLNIVDIILFNDDKGEDVFASSLPVRFAIESNGTYNGLALNFILP